jgi:hypothetical protein
MSFCNKVISYSWIIPGWRSGPLNYFSKSSMWSTPTLSHKNKLHHLHTCSACLMFGRCAHTGPRCIVLSQEHESHQPQVIGRLIRTRISLSRMGLQPWTSRVGDGHAKIAPLTKFSFPPIFSPWYSPLHDVLVKEAVKVEDVVTAVDFLNMVGVDHFEEEAVDEWDQSRYKSTAKTHLQIIISTFCLEKQVSFCDCNCFLKAINIILSLLLSKSSSLFVFHNYYHYIVTIVLIIVVGRCRSS